MDISAEQRRRDFNAWLRTGRWSTSGGREVKFNPWHDPDDGRFTFANSGRYYGRAAAQQRASSGRTASKIVYVEGDRLPPITTLQEVEAWRARELAKHGHNPNIGEPLRSGTAVIWTNLPVGQVPARRLAASPMPPNPPLQARTFVHGRKVVSPAGAAALVGVAPTALGTLLRRNPIKGRVAVQRVEAASTVAEAASAEVVQAERGRLPRRSLRKDSGTLHRAETGSTAAEAALAAEVLRARKTG